MSLQRCVLITQESETECEVNKPGFSNLANGAARCFLVEKPGFCVGYDLLFAALEFEQ